MVVEEGWRIDQRTPQEVVVEVGRGALPHVLEIEFTTTDPMDIATTLDPVTVIVISQGPVKTDTTNTITHLVALLGKKMITIPLLDDPGVGWAVFEISNVIVHLVHPLDILIHTRARTPTLTIHAWIEDVSDVIAKTRPVHLAVELDLVRRKIQT